MKSIRRSAMLGLGMQELIVILVIVMVLFGASRLPELGKGMGSFIKQFKRGLQDTDETNAASKEKLGGEKKVEKT
jgi:sec-independent protein translocase protein TatA